MNRLALRVHTLLARRGVQELGIQRWIFDLLRLQLTAAEAEELLGQVCTAHALRVPVKATEREEDWMARGK